jgi:8-oxo-dGTP pyrophosphatase MutT (NUDIX family)
MSDRNALVTALRKYKSSFAAESVFIPQFLALLEHPRCFSRDHFPGHITASAWITNLSSTHVLLTHHAKLDRWLQPGGHADGEENVLSVALREGREETGLSSLRIKSHNILDLDIHTIPARKEFPKHDHYDIRFLFEADSNEKLVVTEESHDLAWVSLSDLKQKTGNNLSMIRMAEKAVRKSP